MPKQLGVRSCVHPSELQMNVLFSHMDLMPLAYGFIMFVGLAVMLFKFLRGSWLSFAIDVSVFAIVFKLHGGTLTGGFAAMICALLAGLFFPLMIRKLT
jgi:hypothetical protein